jgi:hypothetical protein
VVKLWSMECIQCTKFLSGRTLDDMSCMFAICFFNILKRNSNAFLYEWVFTLCMRPFILYKKEIDTFIPTKFFSNYMEICNIY